MMTLYALFEKLPLTSLLLHLEEEPSFLPRRQTLLLRQTATTPVPLVEQPGLKFVPFTISCYLMVLLAVQISRQCRSGLLLITARGFPRFDCPIAPRYLE